MHNVSCLVNPMNYHHASPFTSKIMPNCEKLNLSAHIFGGVGQSLAATTVGNNYHSNNNLYNQMASNLTTFNNPQQQYSHQATNLLPSLADSLNLNTHNIYSNINNTQSNINSSQLISRQLKKSNSFDQSSSSHHSLHQSSASQQDAVNRSFLAAQQLASVNGASSASNSAAMNTTSRYKTELCRPFEESGECKYGDKCQFAHGMCEMRNLTRHPKYKTELCRTFHSIGFCPYGPRCHFIHNGEEIVNKMPAPSAATHLQQLQGSRRQALAPRQSLPATINSTAAMLLANNHQITNSIIDDGNFYDLGHMITPNHNNNTLNGLLHPELSRRHMSLPIASLNLVGNNNSMFSPHINNNLNNNCDGDNDKSSLELLKNTLINVLAMQQLQSKNSSATISSHNLNNNIEIRRSSSPSLMALNSQMTAASQFNFPQPCNNYNNNIQQPLKANDISYLQQELQNLSLAREEASTTTKGWTNGFDSGLEDNSNANSITGMYSNLFATFLNKSLTLQQQQSKSFINHAGSLNQDTNALNAMLKSPSSPDSNFSSNSCTDFEDLTAASTSNKHNNHHFYKEGSNVNITDNNNNPRLPIFKSFTTTN